MQPGTRKMVKIFRRCAPAQTTAQVGIPAGKRRLVGGGVGCRLRQAVSLGRFCLDPVSELCRLWHIDKINNINHVLTLSLHSDLKYVPPGNFFYLFLSFQI